MSPVVLHLLDMHWKIDTCPFQAMQIFLGLLIYLNSLFGPVDTPGIYMSANLLHN